ncbi:hypothetical protein GQ53DRAFT_697691 [Thozetella sp. PMI_491]|nr:hypothetical protein GQ53DRAFT_697691 [Thozetella sp. PMI_491]
MSFDALQERLAALQETTSQLKELIERLATLKFEPGSIPQGPDDENDPAAELSGEISQILREEEEDLDLLHEEILDLRSGRPGSDSEHNKARLKDGAARLEQELKICRASFRKAQLSARRSLEQAQRLERELLLASYSVSVIGSPQNRSGASSPDQTSNGQAHPSAQLFTARDRRRAAQQKQRSSSHSRADAEVTASSDLTAALRRTHDLISAELSRSEFAQQVLHESTAAMKELQQRYSSLDDMLASSRDLLGTLLKSQKSDTWYLETALYLLLGTLAWLVFRRFLYGPLWWLVWLPIRTVFRTGKAVSNMGTGDGASARMPVVQPGAGGTTVIGVGQRGAVPTIEVGGKPKAEEGDPDSLVEKVGRIIEDNLESDSYADSASGDGVAEGEDNEPNPRKRVWEDEAEGSSEGARLRDEL